MNALSLFLPCAAGVETYLAQEVQGLTPHTDVKTLRGGVLLESSWRDAMRLNLHSRLTQRVLVQLSRTPYSKEEDLYEAASAVAWEVWFTPRHTFKIEITAQHSPLKSLNFAALKIKDAVADRFRAKAGERPSVDTHYPDVRVHAHLSNDRLTLYIDTSGEALFKRGWREDKGEAPLKETLAAAMLYASGWVDELESGKPLYDPCCGSGTIVIEAAQIASQIAPGIQRRFAFEKLLPFQSHIWQGLKEEAKAAERLHASDLPCEIFGSDVAFRMVDFAMRNAQRAGVAHVLQLRGGDALERMPPCEKPGTLVLNPPYGERIEAAGKAGRSGTLSLARAGAHRGERQDSQQRPSRPNVAHFGEAMPPRIMREVADDGEGGNAFFSKLASHWKAHYAGWSAWLLTPDLKLPSKMRLKESRRVPLWNGPIECRMFRFDMSAGKHEGKNAA